MDEVLVGSGRTRIHLSKSLYIEKDGETHFTIVEHGDPNENALSADIAFKWEYVANHDSKIKRNPFGRVCLNTSGYGRIEFDGRANYGFEDNTELTLGTILNRCARYLQIRKALGLKTWDE